MDEEKASADFLEFLLQSFRQSLKNEGKGSAQDNINLGIFETRKFPFPRKKDEQVKIAKKLNSYLKLCKYLESKVTTVEVYCNELKQQILAKAFNGEL